MSWYACVPRQVLNKFGVHASTEQQREAGVPEIVPANVGQPCPPEQRLEVAVDDVLRIEWCTFGGGEDEGILGLSAMVTGIGTVVVLGVTAYAATRYALGGKDRELARQREHMIQEIIKSHQGAIEDLAEDQSAIALKLAEYISRSDQNEARLARLKNDLQMFTAALAELKQQKDNLQAQSV